MMEQILIIMNETSKYRKNENKHKQIHKSIKKSEKLISLLVKYETKIYY